MQSQTKPRPLPPLEAGVAYRAEEFRKFDYYGASLPGKVPILRLNLTNGTTIDLPSNEQAFRDLLYLLVCAFPDDAVEQLKKFGRV